MITYTERNAKVGVTQILHCVCANSESEL